MTIGVGDTVMTPDGVAVVAEIRGDWPVREIWVTFSDDVFRWYAERNLDRLVLDKGLEERVRKLAFELADVTDDDTATEFCLGWNAGMRVAACRILHLLDTMEAEPEPPPDAGVTREELASALCVVSAAISAVSLGLPQKHQDEELQAIDKLIDRLRRGGEGEG